jgi:AGCS family alanine or glycine:cation symporter
MALKDYEKQLDTGVDPTFDPEAVGIKNAEFWSK